MKKFKVISILLVLATIVFGGMFQANAATTLPDAVVSDGLREVEYIKNFPVIVKTAENGRYYIYCMNMSATYASDIKFTKTAKVDDGYIYILNNRPNTGDKDKDFYITQMAVWYYEDYLNQNNFNLVSEVKKYIIKHKDTEDVSKRIYNLYYGAKNYKAAVGKLAFGTDPITFTESDGYYVSSEIKLTAENLGAAITYGMSNAPVGTKVVKSTNGVKVKVPVSAIPAGKQLTMTLSASSKYNKYTGYYYYHSSKYQKVLFQDPLTEQIALKTSVKMVVKKEIEKVKVKVSKTDITQSKEVAGATLVIKDENGKVIDTWVSTTTAHFVDLYPGKYSLTETIAPKGYKLSKTTVEFLVGTDNAIYVKNASGNYVSVDRVVMINELIDVVSFAKKDKATDKLLAGATLVLKDSKGNIVKEFTTTDKVYQMSLEAGVYTLSEKSAPDGYVLSKEVITFKLLDNGTLKVLNDKNEYVDTVLITYYNNKAKEQEVEVPPTDLNSNMLIIGGIALLIGGILYVRKTIKQY